MILAFEVPSDRAASTNLFSRSDNTWSRMTRAMKIELTSAITTITTASPGCSTPPRHPLASLHAAAMPSASSRRGKANSASIKREIATPTEPRK